MDLPTVSFENPDNMIEHLEHLQLTSHVPLIALAIMASAIMFRFRHNRMALAILGITLFFLCLSIVLSFLHHYYKEEFIALSQAEISINSIGIAINVLILLALWFGLGFRTPFQQNEMFVYFLITILFVTGMMMQFLIKGFKSWYAAKIGTDEYSEYHDTLYHLNHIQWHAWISFFGFNYLILLFILLKLYESG
jgi:hypothetical protein